MTLLVFGILTLNAEDIIINNDPLLGGEGPRTSTISIQASIESETLSVNINRYLGDVQFELTEANGTQVYADTLYVNASLNYTLDASTLAPGTYTITFTLEDGTVYAGQFSVE